VKFPSKEFAYIFGALSAIALAGTAVGADADDPAAPTSSTTTNAAVAHDPHYGLFNALDHRSMYTQEVFPEPFLVDDMGLEDNELELTWLHSKAGSQQSDVGSVEIQKGIGLLTLQAEMPYVNDVSPDESTHGIGNIQLGARYPLYQFVSADRFVDATFGVAMEGGVPADSTVGRNAELEPEIFNCLKLGDHFTVQSVLGYSTLLGGGDDGGLRTLEYGFSFAYAIPRRELPLPGVQEFIPMCELGGERGLNLDEAGQNSVLGDVGFRTQFSPIGEVQPGFGLAWVFPVDSGARQELHWGFIVSVIFDF
jgi:hypothetical protein